MNNEGIYSELCRGLMLKMNWRAANAATSSKQELGLPKGGDENFVDSAEEELAYCAQVLDCIGQGLDCPETNMAVISAFIDDVSSTIVGLKSRVDMIKQKMDPLQLMQMTMEMNAAIER